MFPWARIVVPMLTVTLLIPTLCKSASSQALLADYGSDLQSVGSNGAISNYLLNVSSSVYGLAFDTNNNLYVAIAMSNGTIIKVTPNKVVSTFASGLNTPIGVAFDSSGNLFTTQSGSGILTKITSSGVATSFATGLNAPQGIAIDKSDNIYVANKRTGKITLITSNGVISTFASGLIAPSGLVFDSKGNLFVGSFTDSAALYKITLGGIVSTFATGLFYTQGLAIDLADNIYAADDSDVAHNSTIEKITPGGVVSTFATNGFPEGGSCLAFSPTLTVPGSVPEPGAIGLLFGSGVTVVGFAIRRLQRKNRF